MLFKSKSCANEVIKSQSLPVTLFNPYAMGTVHIAKALPRLPEDWPSESAFTVHGSLSAPIHRSIEPVGPHFLAHARRVGLSTTIDNNIMNTNQLIETTFSDFQRG